MRAFIGIEEKEVAVRCTTTYGETYVVSVRDARTGQDIRGYLNQDTLDALAQDWIITEQGAGYALQDVSYD